MIAPLARFASRPSVAVDDGVDLVGVADAEDDEIASLPSAAGESARRGAGGARLASALGAEVAGGDRVAVLDEMLEHREPHAADADDADTFLVVVCHCVPLLMRCRRPCSALRTHAFALSMAASGLPGSASSPASTGMRRSISRRAAAMSRCALMPIA